MTGTSGLASSLASSAFIVPTARIPFKRGIL